MKPEPLKDKIHDPHDDEHKDFCKGKLHCSDLDIKSAVEWLKEKIKIFDMKEKQEAYENNMNQLIDIAFEDVTKK